MRLLLVEDEKSLVKALTAILEGNHYSVDAVYDGQAALDFLEVTTYDGIILDIMLPKLDGLSVLRRIRERGNQVPVLMLTAKSEVEDKVLGLDSGANDYLAKPFATAELLARIRAMTRSRSGRSDSLLRRGNLTLDLSSFELSTPSGSVRLPNKEFQMLEMLMSSPISLIPAGRFIETIWGLDSDIETNVVWVHISCLRKTLTELHANVQIRAVRNGGYRLEDIT